MLGLASGLGSDVETEVTPFVGEGFIWGEPLSGIGFKVRVRARFIVRVRKRVRVRVSVRVRGRGG